MKKSNKVFYFISVVVLALAILTSGLALTNNTAIAADKVIKWKCQSHWPTASSSYKDSLLVIAEKLKTRTNGRLIIEPFPAGSLVPSKEIFNAVKRGMIEMGTGSPAYIRDQISIAGIAAGLPFAFKDVWECVYFHKFLGFEKMMRDATAKHGVYYSTDKIYPTELVLTKPVKTFADFKGLKLRSSGVLQLFLSSIGAAASYLPGAEVYPSLASGVIDGAHWGAAQGANSMGLYEVCKYHLKPGLNIAGTDAWVVNQKAIDRLPKDIREIFLWTLEEHFWKRTNQYIYLEAITLAKVVKEKGIKVITLPPEEQKKMSEVAMKMWEKEGEKSPEAAKALKILKDFLRSLGHI
ncbi:MAG: TRAP transporter substrate-binding protein DctP [Deltaproteobacteria bacterium]|nr:TRAP transporter substrate-binding protein DctP [Deltaproteobacteria bacterium]